MSNKRLFFVFVVVIMILAGCIPSGGSIFAASLPVGSLWQSATQADGSATWDSASPVALEQHSGYLLARQLMIDAKFTDKEYGEGTQQDDIQVTIRHMAETDQVIAVLGATTNAVTMRATSLANFFSIPMIVPSASGDDIMPSTNVWAFRLSPSGSAYANYLFGTVIKASLAGESATSDPAAGTSKNDENAQTDNALKLAILFEENTFGESAAVAAAHAALKESVNIVKYASFSANGPDAVAVNTLVDAVNKAQPDLVYLISSDPSVALQLVTILHARMDNSRMPLILGQSNGFSSAMFLSSKEMQGTYVVRQKLDEVNCPNGVDTIQKAQNYAALYLLNQAVQQAGASFQKPWWKIWPSADPRLEQISAFREKLRDSLKASSTDVPCLGEVAFDNSGENKLLQFEIVVANGDKAEPVSVDIFQNKLKEVMNR